MNAADASFLDILAFVETELARGTSMICIDVVDPDIGRGRYAGELVEHEGRSYVHRSFRFWVDLAERLGLRLCTPRVLATPMVRLTFEPLNTKSRMRTNVDDPSEKYGVASEFARIAKLEDPGFVIDMSEALARANLTPEARVLDLGVNTGDELALLLARVPSLRKSNLVGVDHSASAIAKARERFGSTVALHVADLNALPSLGLGRFDLVLSIGTLQSPGIDDRELVRRVVQDHLAPTGSVIFGFPNCRYIDGEVEYGTRMKNFREPELGLLIKDVAFFRKYLQQHKRHVFVTGKNYVLLTAVCS